VPNDNQDYKDYLYSKNLHVDTCFLNSFFLDGFEKENCNYRHIDICSFDRIIYNAEDITSKKSDSANYKEYLPLQKLIHSNGKQIVPESRGECIRAVKDGYYYNSVYLNKIKIPFFNLFYFIFFIFSIVHLMRKGILSIRFNKIT